MSISAFDIICYLLQGYALWIAYKVFHNYVFAAQMNSNTNEADRLMTLNGKHIMVVFGSGGHTTEMLMILGKSANIFDKYGKLEEKQMQQEVIRSLIGRMINDVTIHSQLNLNVLKPETVDDIRSAQKMTVTFSDNMKEQDKALKAFLMKNMYRHYKVNRMSSKARRVVTDLFNLYLTEPECLPTEWQVEMQTRTASERARRVADFIAGMTDRFALLEHRRLFDTSTFEL